MTNVVDISCGGNVCVALKGDDTAYVWGDDSWGGLVPSSVTLTSVADISCGANSCVARKTDNTGYAWGSSVYGGGDASSVDLTNVAEISCGMRACVALKGDDTAVAWGDSNGGAGGAGDVSSVDLTNVAEISCGGWACYAIKNDAARTAEVWGVSAKGGDIRCTDATCTPLPTDVDLTNVAAISCGSSSCVVLKNDGNAYAWGLHGHGGDIDCGAGLVNNCTPLPSGVLTDGQVAAVSCGANACVALKYDGIAYAWGRTGSGGDASTVDLTNVADISCGNNACVARKNDGTAEAWGDPAKGGDLPFSPFPFDPTLAA